MFLESKLVLPRGFSLRGGKHSPDEVERNVHNVIMETYTVNALTLLCIACVKCTCMWAKQQDETGSSMGGVVNITS